MRTLLKISYYGQSKDGDVQKWRQQCPCRHDIYTQIFVHVVVSGLLKTHVKFQQDKTLVNHWNRIKEESRQNIGELSHPSSDNFTCLQKPDIQSGEKHVWYINYRIRSSGSLFVDSRKHTSLSTQDTKYGNHHIYAITVLTSGLK